MYILFIVLGAGVVVYLMRLQGPSWKHYTLNDTAWDWAQEDLNTPSKMDGWK